MKPADLPKNVVAARFENRGKIMVLAAQIEKEIKDAKAAGKKSKYDFESMLWCNLGNPMAVGMKPFSFVREVIGLISMPHLHDNAEVMGQFKSDVVERAKWFHKVATGGKGIGSYTPSLGYTAVRDRVADFITARDQRQAGLAGITKQLPSASGNDVFLTNGASQAVVCLLQLCLGDPSTNPTILGGVPLYPLYSARSAIHFASIENYFFKEEENWSISVEELQRAYDRARRKGKNVTAVEIIQPGNPTGAMLSRDRIREIITWALSVGVAVIADEVYQDNIYDGQFHSFREVLYSDFSPAEQKKLKLVSMGSVSKNLGECGLRGGWIQLDNISTAVRNQLIKLASINLCPNSVGQIAVDCLARPPREGEPSYPQWIKEWNSHNESLKQRAKLVEEGLNKIDGIRCQRLTSAMYAFPRIYLPNKFVEEAKVLQVSPDFHWCQMLVRRGGVVTVPGSGFGEEKGTYHMRTTILPSYEGLQRMLDEIKHLQEYIAEKYGPPEYPGESSNTVSKL